MSLLLLAIACSPTVDAPASSVKGEDATTTPLPEVDMELSSDFVDGVLQVAFETDDSSSAWVEFGPDTNYGSTTTVGSSTSEHLLMAVGFPAGQLYHWRVVIEDESGERVATEDQLLNAPTWDGPMIQRTLDMENPTDLTLLLYTNTSASVVLVNGNGEPVWGRSFGAAEMGNAWTTGTTISWILRSDDFSGIVTEDLLTGEQTQLALEEAHHAFVKLPDGTTGYIVRDVRESDGVMVAGDAIMELSPDGEQKMLWSTWDNVPVNTVDDTGFYGDAVDWTHCNGLSYRDDVDQYLLSCRHTSAIYAVDRKSGRNVWTFGSDDGDVTLKSGTAFSNQHAPYFSEGTLWLFDNTEFETSRGVGYAMNEDNLEATETFSFSGNTHVGAHGNFQPLGAERFLAGWGDTGIISEIHDGQVVWELQSGESDLAWAARIGPIGGEVQ